MPKDDGSTHLNHVCKISFYALQRISKNPPFQIILALKMCAMFLYLKELILDL